MVVTCRVVKVVCVILCAVSGENENANAVCNKDAAAVTKLHVIACASVL